MTPRTLLLLRHAKSSWKHQELEDHDRPLSGRGKRDAPRVGRYLRERRLRPDVVLVSTARRAQATADAVCGEAGVVPDARLDEPRLYLAAPDTWIDVLREQPLEAATVLAVGHNPGIEDLASALSGVRVEMPTAALVLLELPLDRWSRLTLRTRGRLCGLWTPRDD